MRILITILVQVSIVTTVDFLDVDDGYSVCQCQHNTRVENIEAFLHGIMFSMKSNFHTNWHLQGLLL
jgi:hypothetical protein